MSRDEQCVLVMRTSGTCARCLGIMPRPRRCDSHKETGNCWGRPFACFSSEHLKFSLIMHDVYRIYTFLDTGALWKRSYMAQNQLRHHITFSYFPSCDLDAIFSVECSWHTGDFAQNCWKNEHFFAITFITKNYVPALKITNFDNKTACGGAHQRCASRLHNPVAVDHP